jgi:hypothetical protein
VAAAALAAIVAGCGSSADQATHEPSGRFPVAVTNATFPASQRLAQPNHLVIAVRNAGDRAIPDVAVSICNVTCAYRAPAGQGTSVAPFSTRISGTDLANPSRPIWIVQRPPGPCGYSCRNGGPGAGVTAYSNTWALGRLAPGRTARFDWTVTAVSGGRHVVAWQVAAGLNGKARAVTRHGGAPQGTFTVRIGVAPARTHVDPTTGKVVASAR